MSGIDGRGAGSSAETTKEAPSADYHDYVFAGGRLVGDFEGMYRHATEVPWRQDVLCDRWFTEVGFLMIRDHGPYQAILEAGCGLGFIAARLRAFLEGNHTVLDAFDISQAAISRASAAHPGIDFYVDDLAGEAFRPRRPYDLVVVKDLFWYVCDRLDIVLRNLDSCVERGGLLCVIQSFPGLDGDFVGKKDIPSVESLRSRFSGYEPVAQAVVQNHLEAADGPILHFLGRKP